MLSLCPGGGSCKASFSGFRRWQGDTAGLAEKGLPTRQPLSKWPTPSPTECSTPPQCPSGCRTPPPATPGSLCSWMPSPPLPARHPLPVCHSGMAPPLSCHLLWHTMPRSTCTDRRTDLSFASKEMSSVRFESKGLRLHERPIHFLLYLKLYVTSASDFNDIRNHLRLCWFPPWKHSHKVCFMFKSFRFMK